MSVNSRVYQRHLNPLQVPITVTGSLFYRIIDGYKACFKVTDLERNIQNFGTSAMRAVLGTFSYDQVCLGSTQGGPRSLLPRLSATETASTVN